MKEFVYVLVSKIPKGIAFFIFIFIIKYWKVNILNLGLNTKSRWLEKVIFYLDIMFQVFSSKSLSVFRSGSWWEEHLVSHTPAFSWEELVGHILL